MKISRSSVVRDCEIGDLPRGKCSICFGGEDYEGIWIAKDEKNKLMYLLNHALGFYPIPSWGMELPLKDEIDLIEYRGNSFDETSFTLCQEAYDNLEEYLVDGQLDLDK